MLLKIYESFQNFDISLNNYILFASAENYQLVLAANVVRSLFFVPLMPETDPTMRIQVTASLPPSRVALSPPKLHPRSITGRTLIGTLAVMSHVEIGNNNTNNIINRDERMTGEISANDVFIHCVPGRVMLRINKTHLDPS